MNELTHKPPPSPSSQHPLFFSPSLTLLGLLEGAWLHFQSGATRGSVPWGRLAGNEGSAHCALCFQHYTSAGGRENYPSPVAHLILCVYLQDQSEEMCKRGVRPQVKCLKRKECKKEIMFNKHLQSERISLCGLFFPPDAGSHLPFVLLRILI